MAVKSRKLLNSSRLARLISLAFFFQNFLGDNWPARSASRSPTKTGNLSVQLCHCIALVLSSSTSDERVGFLLFLYKWLSKHPHVQVQSRRLLLLLLLFGLLFLLLFLLLLLLLLRLLLFLLLQASKTYFSSLLRHHPPFPYQDKGGLINSLLKTQITSKV